LSSPSFGGEVLQQSKTGQDFDFAGFDAVFLAVTLPEDDLFLTTFKRELGSRGAVKVLKHSSEEILSAMALSNMWLFASIKPVHSLPLFVFETSVKTSAQTTKNRVPFNGVVWSMLSILKDEKKSLKEALELSLRAFLNQYFETNPKAKGKVVFFFTDPSCCEHESASESIGSTAYSKVSG